MKLHRILRAGVAATLAASGLFACCASLPAHEAARKHAPSAAVAAAAQMAEVRRSFTIGGKPIPPEIFRDFGDGDLGDSENIWITVNAADAIGSELYGDAITTDGKTDRKTDHSWRSQKRARGDANDGEETAYEYIGATANGLLVVLSAYSGGGSGNFITLHILDLSAPRAIGIAGKMYRQIDLTLVRSVPLGDRWNGDVKIAKNSIVVTTTRSGPADDSGKRRTMTIKAERY